MVGREADGKERRGGKEKEKAREIGWERGGRRREKERDGRREQRGLRPKEERREKRAKERETLAREEKEESRTTASMEKLYSRIIVGAVGSGVIREVNAFC